MDENTKQKYLDKLKRISTHELKKDARVLVVQNDTCFNPDFNLSIQNYDESKFGPNDLLAKVERYNKANPKSYITKNRLSVKRGFHKCNHQSNKQIQSTEQKVCSVQDLENVLSFIEPKQRVISYMPDTKIKFGPPNATSTIKHQQIQSLKQNDESNGVEKNNKISKISEKKNYGICSSSSGLISPMTIKKNTGVYSNVLLDQELKYEHPETDEKATLNLTYCLYLEFIHSHCDEIKNISEKVYPKNDYSIKSIKQLQGITKEQQNNVFTDDTCLTNIVDDKSWSISNSNFIFKPVINLPNSPDIYSSKCFQDSIMTESFNIYNNKKNNSIYQSTSVDNFTSFASFSKKKIQKSNNEEESNSKECFKYSRKMF